MSLSRSSLEGIPTSYATVSIGSPDDPLEPKLKAISTAGFQAIELGFPDLLSFASKHLKKEVKENDYDNLCEAGKEVKQLCTKHNLKIMMLQPFANFEGWPAESKERQNAFDRANGWIRIMQAVGTDMLQVGSSDAHDISSNFEQLANDLASLADILAKHNFRLAYENWCWATHAPHWSSAWQIVKLANRPNIGLCLDTFQTAGSELADPTTKSGLIEVDPETGKPIDPEMLKQNFAKSLQKLSQEIPAEKIYLLQISDAYKPAKPLEKKEVEGMRPRARWSHDYRPIPFSSGYLPVVEVAKAVLKTGTRSAYFSYEVFDGGAEGKEERVRVDEFEQYAKKATESCKKLLDECADGP